MGFVDCCHAIVASAPANGWYDEHGAHIQLFSIVHHWPLPSRDCDESDWTHAILIAITNNGNGNGGSGTPMLLPLVQLIWQYFDG